MPISGEENRNGFGWTRNFAKREGRYDAAGSCSGRCTMNVPSRKFPPCKNISLLDQDLDIDVFFKLYIVCS